MSTERLSQIWQRKRQFRRIKSREGNIKEWEERIQRSVVEELDTRSSWRSGSYWSVNAIRWDAVEARCNAHLYLTWGEGGTQYIQSRITGSGAALIDCASYLTQLPLPFRGSATFITPVPLYTTSLNLHYLFLRSPLILLTRIGQTIPTLLLCSTWTL